MPRGTAVPVMDALKPGFALRICIGCGAGAAWKYDRKGRPFHYCSNCGLRIWIYHPKSLQGIALVHALVLRHGVQKFRQSVAMNEMRRSMRSPISV